MQDMSEKLVYICPSHKQCNQAYKNKQNQTNYINANLNMLKCVEEGSWTQTSWS